MDLLIRSAVITDPESSHNGQTRDILIREGVIRKIGTGLEKPEGTEELNIPGLHVSPGFVDMQANFRDPGHEYKEDLRSGSQAAVRGGFTRVCIQSSTQPALDHKSAIESVCKQSESLPVDILPIGALTNGREGKEMAELYDMQQAGAIAFSDDKRPVNNPKLLELILEYARNFNGLIIHFPDTTDLTRNAMMNEGEMSVNLGLKGFPPIAEELALNRDLYLLEYTGSRMHVPLISSGNSVKLIAQAKEKGLRVSAGIAPHYLLFNEQVMAGFDSVHKVKPPYRTDRDIEMLKKGLKNGSIEVICSDHSPEDTETKRCELEHAAFGIINIETCFAAAHTALKNELTLDELVEKLSINPRKILQLQPATIEENNQAELSFFDPEHTWNYTDKESLSKSRNSPFSGYSFTGRVKGIFHKNKLHLVY